MPVQISRLSFSPGTHSKEVELVISDPSDQKEIPEIWIQARFPFDSSKSDAKLHVLAQNAIAELQRLAAEAQSAAGAIELRSCKPRCALPPSRRMWE